MEYFCISEFLCHAICTLFYETCNCHCTIATGHYPSQVKCWKGSYINTVAECNYPQCKINAFFYQGNGLVAATHEGLLQWRNARKPRHTYQRPEQQFYSLGLKWSVTCNNSYLLGHPLTHMKCVFGYQLVSIGNFVWLVKYYDLREVNYVRILFQGKFRGWKLGKLIKL